MANTQEKVQIINCRNCGKTFSVWMAPDCYTDDEYLKELKKYSAAGNTIDLVNLGDQKLEGCECDKLSEVAGNNG